MRREGSASHRSFARRGDRIRLSSQFEALTDFLGQNGPLSHVDVQFTIPPLPIANFRNHRELGGGCLLDMGPYAAGVMRMLGGDPASQVRALTGGRHPETGVDMGFTVQARLANGAIFRPFQLRGRIPEPHACGGAFGLRDDRTRL
ncbi:hypothetical protein [Bradyrhizobium sp. JYMT SZCCT0428]|uniref:Gfo/Idh/MocA family protein n=1 Tax=Bradyrhizobium sp. JYMT SZCCT0428 TaxID=2807673 RepID=UPI0039088B99